MSQLDLKLVHQKAIPSIWNQIKYDTFPCNYVTIGFVPGSTKDLQVENEGMGGLYDVLPTLRSDSVQYCGFRVSRQLAVDHDYSSKESELPANHTESKVGGAKLLTPSFVFLRWVGTDTSHLQRASLEEDLDFLKGYFSEATSVVCVSEDTLCEGDVETAVPHLVEQTLRKTLAEAGAVGEEEVDVEYDFRNLNTVKVCTHYDRKDEGDEAAMDTDALYNAVKAFEAEQDRQAKMGGNEKEAFPEYGSANDPNVMNMLGEGMERASGKQASDEDHPRAPSTRARPAPPVVKRGFLNQPARGHEAPGTDGAMALIPFTDELKRAATSHTELDEMVQEADRQRQELRSLEEERVALTQQKMYMYQEQAEAVIQAKRRSHQERLARRLEKRRKKVSEADTDLESFRETVRNVEKSRERVHGRIAQRIVERRLAKLESRSMQGYEKLVDVEKRIDTNSNNLERIRKK
jgi:hypothetical protein